MKKRTLLTALICLLLAAVPMAGTAEWTQQPEGVQEVTTVELTRLMHSGEAQALPLDAGDPLAVVGDDGAVYGCICKLYQTWLRVADDSLWQQVGLEPVQGVVDWETLTEMAQRVAAYNETAQEKIMLFCVQPQRFPNAFAPLASVKDEWDAMASVTGDGPALLTEQVMPIEEIGAGTYVAGIRVNGEVWPLSKLEARCLTLGAQADASSAAHIARFAQDVSPVQTGVLPEDMDEAALRAAWPYSMPVPSAENIALWKQFQ